MDVSCDVMLSKEVRHKRIHTVRFHFYEVQEQAKLIYGKKKKVKNS